MKKPKVRCPSVGDFRLIPETCRDDLDVIVIDRCCGTVAYQIPCPLFWCKVAARNL
jgi:hypothetical protein